MTTFFAPFEFLFATVTLLSLRFLCFVTIPFQHLKLPQSAAEKVSKKRKMEIAKAAVPRSQKLRIQKCAMKKKTGFLGYIGDEFPPSYVGIIINHFKHPY